MAYFPLPWEARCRGKKIDIVSVTPTGECALAQVYLNSYNGKVVSQEYRDSAKHLLCACNTHQILVDALRQVQARLEQRDTRQELLNQVEQALAVVAFEEDLADKVLKKAGDPCRICHDMVPIYVQSKARIKAKSGPTDQSE